MHHPAARPAPRSLALAALAGAALAASASAAPRPAAPPALASGHVLDAGPQTVAEKARALRAAEGRHVILRFEAPLTEGQREKLEASGVRVLGSAGGFARLAVVDARAAAANAEALRPVHAVSTIDPEWKLHPLIKDGVAPGHAVVRLEEGSRDKRDDALAPTVALNVLFHKDVAPAKAEQAVRAAGGRVRTALRSVNAAVVHLPEDRIAELAKQDAVLFVEPPIPALTGLNAENRAVTTTDAVQAAPYNLSGAGVTAFVYDGGTVLSSHPDFAGRLTVIDSDGVSDHSTHVAGTLAGDGAASSGEQRGMAPAADILSAGFEFDPGGTFLYTNPGDIEDDYTEAINSGADLSNNSIGSNVEPNGFNCAFQGDYGLTSSVIDSIVRGGLTGSPFRVVWAAGNERQGSDCNIEGLGDYASVAPPSGAKNHISVGAINSNDESMTTFSSWGPTDDGRLIPTIAAPGCQVGEDDGVTSAGSFSTYTVKCGTSMAAPTVAGIAALLLEDYRANFPELPDFRNAFLKALLAHTAEDLGNAGPDYQFGYGGVRAQAAVDQLRSANFSEEVVAQGETYAAVAVVAPGDDELKITIAWDDAPGVPLAASALVNDLDLVVTSPSGQRFYPWTLDPQNPSAAAAQDAEDHTNNIEQVHVQNPEPGGWNIEVVGTNVPEGPQPFGLVVSPFLVNCADQGTVRLDTDLYACDDILDIRVVDCGLNTSDSVIDTVSVNLSSTSNPAGINVTLTETAPEAAAFTAVVSIADDGSGDLLVAPGDTITAEYIDADTGDGSSAIVADTAGVDCTAPVIANVAVSDVEPRSAAVSIDTDEPAMVLVRWGETCGDWAGEIMTASLETAHEIAITGLQDDTQYFFEVEAVDGAGNWTFDDNGGACFDFTTPEIPDFFTEEFATPIDLAGKRLEFTPNGSIDFYDACLSDVFQLPVDTTGAENLGLGDDSSTSRSLAPGRQVSLYGVSYSTVHIGPNGYVTFGSGDSDFTESFADHFDLPRISAAFDDLHPGQGGAVLWQELADRAVVTFDQVPERNASPIVTAQIELFYDGRLAISWLDAEIDDAIVGLSDGSGVNPDFLPSDLSALASCGPRPPFAGAVEAAVPANGSTEIELEGSDDGLPGGPLTFTITELPVRGHLADASGLITSVPHAMAPGDTSVRYAPLPGYQGPDAFAYTVSDGGTAPGGGDSPNTGSVAITAGGLTAVYEFLTDDSDPGWEREGEWAFGVPAGGSGSSGGPDPSAAYSGDNVFGYNLGGGYDDNIPEYALTTGPIDCTELEGVAVEFQRWLGVESSQYDHAEFEISTDDGDSWSTVWSHTGSSFSDSDWTLREHDLSAIADGETIRLRWIMGTSDFTVDYCGWNIDDVRVLALESAEIVCPHDLTGDGKTDSSDLGVLLSAWGRPAAGYLGGDVNGDGIVNSDDLGALLSLWNPAGCP